MVQASLAEKNRLAAAGAASADIKAVGEMLSAGAATAAGGALPDAELKLYVGGLHFSIAVLASSWSGTPNS